MLKMKLRIIMLRAHNLTLEVIQVEIIADMEKELDTRMVTQEVTLRFLNNRKSISIQKNRLTISLKT